MISLQPDQPAEISFVLTIKRAATGEEEHYNMVGTILPQPEEHDNVGNALDGRPQRGD